MRLHLLVLICAGQLVDGCGARSGYVYSVASNARGRVTFLDAVADRGEVQVTFSDGERCVGRYATIPGRVTMDDREFETIDEELTQEGLAILKCEGGHFLRCSISRDITGAGDGR